MCVYTYFISRILAYHGDEQTLGSGDRRCLSRWHPLARILAGAEGDCCGRHGEHPRSYSSTLATPSKSLYRMCHLFSVRVHLLDNEHYWRAPRRDRHHPRHHLVDHPRLQCLAHALLPDRRQDVLYSAPRPRHTDPERVRGERRGDRRLAGLELDAVQLAAWGGVPPEQPRRVSLWRPDESERRATADGLHAVVERRAVESERG